MSLNTPEQCWRWLDQHAVTKDGQTQQRFSKKLSLINLLEFNPKVILVAGTNGKGSTCHAIEALLLAAKQSVGCLTSPHLISIAERIRVNGITIDDDSFCQSFQFVADLYQDEPFTWFEFLTMQALSVFKTQRLDYWVLELGIGGRYDILNSVEPDVSVITSIGLDHTDLLGDNIGQIAWQKAGIFRRGKPAICGLENPPEELYQYAEEVGCNLMVQNDHFSYSSEQRTWQWHMATQQFNHLPQPNIPIMNASTALATVMQFDDLHLSESQVARVFANLQVPGRLQRVAQQPQILCDVAHNPQACRHLASYLVDHAISGREIAVLGMKADKDIAGCLASFSKQFTHYYIVSLEQEELAQAQFVAYFTDNEQSEHVTYCASALQALKKAKAIAGKNDRITVFGSFQTVGPVLQEIQQGES